jgi:hypothetical protein
MAISPVLLKLRNGEVWEQFCFNICDSLWENPAKVARQNSEKKGKSKKKFLVRCPSDILSIPKCKNTFRSAFKFPFSGERRVY